MSFHSRLHIILASREKTEGSAKFHKKHDCLRSGDEVRNYLIIIYNDYVQRKKTINLAINNFLYKNDNRTTCQ